MHNSSLIKQNERTEEVANIIDRMPTNFGYVTSILIFSIIALFLTLGWFIKYPNILKGEIIINSRQAPIKLVSKTNGNLMLIHRKSGESLKVGEYIAYIKSSAKLEDVKRLDHLLENFYISQVSPILHRHYFPENLSLGDLNSNYFGFISYLLIV
jgi:hypothetical protein